MHKKLLKDNKTKPVCGFLLATKEIFLKSQGVREILTRKLINNITFFLQKRGIDFNISDSRSRIFIKTEEHRKTIPILRKIFGLAWFAKVFYFRDEELADIISFVNDNYKEWIKKDETFALRLKKDSGIKEKTDEIIDGIAKVIKRKVNLDHPRKEIFIERRNEGWFLYFKKSQGMGGLPCGSQGKVLSLMSGGIDSPVASWMIARRGGENVWVHFHSFPLVSRKSIEKVEDLAKKFLDYQPKLEVYFVSFGDIQKRIKTGVPAKYRVLLYRRMMLKISEKIANRDGYEALITGESLGQVSSQTLPNMYITENIVKIPVLRPLIATDKQEITSMARKIGSFDISIRPHEDCCTLFVPKHSTAMGRIELVKKFEKQLQLSKLISDAVKNIEYVVF